MKNPVLPILILILTMLACGQATPPAAVTATPSVLVDPSHLWYLVLGDTKSDQAWGVDVDATGNIYLGAFEQKLDQWFTDMVIYKFSSGG